MFFKYNFFKNVIAKYNIMYFEELKEEVNFKLFRILRIIMVIRAIDKLYYKV
jgi:hypothetical protein